MKASIAKSKQSLAISYGQYANQFAKVIEVLKDNRTAARMYVDSMGSSIDMLKSKMEATDTMKNATQGLAEVFEIKDGYVFQEAMSAATMAISQNIAGIRSNLDFLDENNSLTIGGTPSQEELTLMINKLQSKNFETFSVSATASPYHDLTEDETPDKAMKNLLD